MKKKALILNFVESQGEGGARYTDIIKFIFEYNHPGFEYTTRNRGYYSSGFSQHCRWTGKDGRYLLNGYDRLEKMDNGNYRTIRRKKLTANEISNGLDNLTNKFLNQLDYIEAKGGINKYR